MNALKNLFKVYRDNIPNLVFGGAIGGMIGENVCGVVDCVRDNKTFSEGLGILPSYSVIGGISGAVYMGLAPITLTYTLAIGANKTYNYWNNYKSLPKDNSN